jgi:4-methyl-5(b-hydroxyethyl)-thiazole monophosphate biosynthesis
MVYVLLADGCEEIEALAPVDVLRRGGCEVKTVGITGKTVSGSHGIKIEADVTPEEVNDDIELLVFPGGLPGADYLDASPYTDKFIEMAQKNGGRIAAICASPYVLGKRGLLENKKATCYPSEKFISQLKGATYTGEKVVTDGKITTSSGMGAALLFGCELLALLKGEEVASSIASSAIIK